MVRNDLNSRRLDYDCTSTVEALCVSVKHNNSEFCVANFYRNNVADVTVLEPFECVHKLLADKGFLL